MKSAKNKLIIKNNSKILKQCVKFAILLLAIVVVFAVLNQSEQVACFAENEAYVSDEEIEKQFGVETNAQVEELDFSKLDSELDVIGDDIGVFQSRSFKEYVYSVINGDIVADFGSIFSAVKEGAVSSFKGVIASFSAVVVLAILFSLYNSFAPTGKVSNVIKIMFASSIAIVLLLVSKGVVEKASQAMKSMQNQMNIIFPILIGLINVAGAGLSVKMFQPSMLFLSSVISNVFSYFLMPLFLITVGFTVVESLSTENNFFKFSRFTKSLFKWTIGVVFGVFMSVLTIGGITSGASAGVSVKATKYALKNYIPYLGGYVSDGFELSRASAILIKNSVGFSSLMLLLATIISPIVSIGVFSLALNLISSICKPIINDSQNSLIQNFADAFKMLTAIVVGVAVMYFYMLSLVVSTVNIV
ncbi:MAG: stage III sporulation protein AE [Clostridia bacterium]|nr:stage III sporulation protein AE [Clostridia bacterium]